MLGKRIEAIGVLAFVFPVLVSAEQVTVRFVASVDSIADFSGGSLLNNTPLAIGDELFGSYSYNTQAVDTDGSEAVGDYTYNSPPNAVSIAALSGLSLSSGFPTPLAITNLRVWNDLDNGVGTVQGADDITLFGRGVSVDGSIVASSITVGFRDEPGTLLDSDSPPNLAPPVAHFPEQNRYVVISACAPIDADGNGFCPLISPTSIRISATITFTELTTQPTGVDNDGVDDASDNCPLVPNPTQLNTDGADDGGDACDADDDNDLRPDSEDNCPLIYNPDQADTDNNGRGDACEGLPPGC